MNNTFFNLKLERFNHFNVIIITFKKKIGEPDEWNEFFNYVDAMFDKMVEKYVLILDISYISFPGVYILKRGADILNKYPDNIDKYTIESKIIAPESYVSKSILKILFSIYKSRRPIKVEYSLEKSYNDVLEVVKKYSEN